MQNFFLKFRCILLSFYFSIIILNNNIIMNRYFKNFALQFLSVFLLILLVLLPPLVLVFLFLFTFIVVIGIALVVVVVVVVVVLVVTVVGDFFDSY